MLFSRYASNLLKMCRFVNLDLRLSTDVRRMIYRKDSSVLDLFNICGFNNSSADVFFYPQMLDRCYTDGIICLRSVLYVSGHFRPVSKEFDDFLIKESGM